VPGAGVCVFVVGMCMLLLCVCSHIAHKSLREERVGKRPLVVGPAAVNPNKGFSIKKTTRRICSFIVVFL
jgi:hypothetical protein